MGNYNVQIQQVPSLQLGKSDIVFEVKLEGDMLGSLRVSKGHIVWRPANCTYGHWLNWSDFDKVLREKGRRRKVNF